MSEDISTRIARYKAWLARQPMDRPLFGLFWEPDIPAFPALIERVGVGSELFPEQIDPQEVLPFIERWYQRHAQLDADTFQRFCPAFGIPWVEAIAGCRVVVTPDSLWAQPFLKSYADRPQKRFDPDNPWMRKLIEFTRVLVELSNGRFPVALPQMRGPLDTLAALRTPERMCLDFYDDPDSVHQILGELSQLYIEINDAVLEVIPPFQGGYATRMHLWGPGHAITPQNDVSTLTSPAIYERFVLPWDRKIIARFPYQSFHLHATEYHIIDLLLTIDELTAIQVTLEHTQGGPSLEVMLPILKRVLEHKPLILVALDFESAERCLQELSSEGLCLMIFPDSTAGDFGRAYDDWLELHCS